jgi:hypothetical protein
MLWVRTFFANLEIVSSDGQVASGNFLLYNFYEFLFRILITMKNIFSKLYPTRTIQEQNRAQQNDAFATVDDVTLTHSLDQVIIEWMTFSLPGNPTVSAEKTFSWAVRWTLCTQQQFKILFKLFCQEQSQCYKQREFSGNVPRSHLRWASDQYRFATSVC